MKNSIVDVLMQAAKELDLELRDYREYSGRGLFGRRTNGVVFRDIGAFAQAVALAAHNITEADHELDFGEVSVGRYVRDQADRHGIVRDLSLDGTNAIVDFDNAEPREPVPIDNLDVASRFTVDFDEFVEGLSSLSQDNLGYDTIVY